MLIFIFMELVHFGVAFKPFFFMQANDSWYCRKSYIYLLRDCIYLFIYAYYIYIYLYKYLRLWVNLSFCLYKCRSLCSSFPTIKKKPSIYCHACSIPVYRNILYCCPVSWYVSHRQVLASTHPCIKYNANAVYFPLCGLVPNGRWYSILHCTFCNLCL